MSATEKVCVLVTIDTECDHDPRWVRSKPLTFDSILRGLPDRLQPVFGAAGAVPTYLLTVEVMEDEACAGALRQLPGAHELGTHLHSAFIEPEKKFFDYAGVDSPDFQCHCAPTIEEAKLRNLTALFERRFGYRPKSFRAGRYGAGSNTIRALGGLGYSVDTSVTPHIRWPHPDGAVDYRRAPQQPYFPSPDDLASPRSSGQGDVLEIPVTMRPRLLRGPKWLRPWFSSVAEMRRIIDYHLQCYADQRLIVLNMMFHSMEVIPKASPYPQDEADVSRFLDDLFKVLDGCRARGFEFLGAAGVPALLKAGASVSRP